MREWAEASGVSKALVHKAQGGTCYTIKGPSVIKLLRGLGLGPESPEWQQAVVLWTSERVEEPGGGSALRQRLVLRLSAMTVPELRKIQDWLDHKRAEHRQQ